MGGRPIRGGEVRVRAPLILGIGLALLVGIGAVPRRALGAEMTPLQVFFVRHAEKASEGDDPPLNEIGRKRARALAHLLRDAGIEGIHSSDTRRTRETGAPLAAELGLEIQIYDPRDLSSLVARLRASGGRHLVIGHTNTTPVAVGLLGGEAGAPIDEAREYDRLYLVVVSEEQVDTVILRY